MKSSGEGKTKAIRIETESESLIFQMLCWMTCTIHQNKLNSPFTPCFSAYISLIDDDPIEIEDEELQSAIEASLSSGFETSM